MDNKPDDVLEDSSKEAVAQPDEPHNEAQADHNSAEEKANTEDADTEPVDLNEVVGTVQLPIVEPKSHKKSWIGLIAAIVVLLLVLGGVLLYMTLGNQPKKTSSNNTAVTPVKSEAPHPKTATETVDLIKPLLKGQPITVAKTDATSGSDAQNDVVYTVPYYKVSGKKFLNYPHESSGMAAQGDKATTAADYTAVTEFLTKNGFKEIHPGPEFNQSTVQVSAGVYASDTVVCNVENNDYTNQALKSYFTGIGCANVLSYAQEATEIDPFYAAYVASPDVKQHPEYITSVYISDTPTINDGAAGYKNATMGIGSAMGLFYQEPGKDWVYFKGTQNEMSCTDFDTDTLKKAFAGQKCYDTATQTDSVVMAS